MSSHHMNSGRHVHRRRPAQTGVASSGSPLPPQNSYIHHQPLQQGLISQEASVVGAAAVYTEINAPPPAAIFLAGHEMRAQPAAASVLHAPTATEYTDPLQNGDYPPPRGMFQMIVNENFGNEELGGGVGGRLVEDYRLSRDEQVSLDAYLRYANTSLGLQYPVPAVDAGGNERWNYTQPLPQGSLTTDTWGYNPPPSTPYPTNNHSFGQNIVGDRPPVNEWLSESVVDAGSTGVGDAVDDSSDSRRVKCYWGGCTSDELHDRDSLWKHIRAHIRHSHHSGSPNSSIDQPVCRWIGCTYTKGFGEPRSLRRHIDNKHAFPSPFRCEQCGRCLKRSDKLAAHLGVCPSSTRSS